VLQALLQSAAATTPDAVLVAAMDADAPGDRLAERLKEIAGAAGAKQVRLRPPDECKDWNQVIQQGRGLP
jgi:predicted nuclease with TOPRIM domain